MPAETLSVRVRLARSGDAGAFTLEAAFEAAPGITILFGPSGSGKSTILAAIAGLMRPDQGRIALGDQVWFDSARRLETPIQRRGVAFVFQSLALFPHMTAAANVQYGMARSLPRAERRQRAEATLARLRVGHLADRKPRTFSGGEAQRVALARAFAISPRVMLLDEPFSALDRTLRRELVADVRSLVDEARIPLIQVTHHRNEARAMADHVVMLEAGRVVAQGSAAELLTDGGPGFGARDFDDTTPIPTVRRSS